MWDLQTLIKLNEEAATRRQAPSTFPKPLGAFVVVVKPTGVAGGPYFLTPDRRVMYDLAKVQGHQSARDAEQWIARNLGDLGVALGDEIRIVHRSESP